MSVDTEKEEGVSPDSTSLRDALTNAFDKVTDSAPEPDEEKETAPDAPTNEEPPKSTATGQRVRQPNGRFTRTAAGAPVEEKAQAIKPTTPVAPGVTPAPAALKAPQSWTPTARETWAKLPPEAQAEIHRREKEVATTLQQSAEDRKFAQSMRNTFAPYEGQIRAEGSNPAQAVERLLQTAMALRTAPPAHKAKMVADIITGYGVPLEGLVAALSGQQAPQQRQQQMYDPRQLVDQIKNEVFGTFQQQRAESFLNQARDEADSFFADKEFADDLREDMADLIEVRGRRGLTTTLEEAYNLASRQHPHVSEVVKQREMAAAAGKANASTQRSRLAASSVRSNPAAPPDTGGQPKDLRSSILAAFNAHSGRT